ncbi:hypothetical protein F5Y18DRAFT_386984 [Xylariaceae sp. FL1019]|nr:hypothetical protein F5Y18DRAFT_386984 [Xylariaceae sp. FL1019]
MSRKLGKGRAASSKATPGFGSTSFGGFSTAASGTNLSYLAEPSDFSAIPDAHVVVSFKNLQKKDATTKGRALEELLAYVQDHPFENEGGVGDPVLEAWVQSYPRISIDNSRRVRELSHVLQLELMRSARKRMEKNVPRIVGSWLAGTFDKDRGVSRAATEGLSSFLTTPEKIVQFWKRCQQQILDYASDAIRETTDTLSDQRSTNADDAEAKYSRVLAGSLALVLNLLRQLEPADIEKCLDTYDLFFENDKVWASALANDSNVRRLSAQLLSICIQKRAARIGADLTRLSKVFISEGLKSDQTGSVIDFLEAVKALTAKFPTTWTSDYKSKKSSLSRLKLFLESGSYGGPAKYWTALSELISILPSGILPKDFDGAVDTMKAMRKGVTGRDELRGNAVDGWTAYLSLARHFLREAQSSDTRIKFAQETIFPLIEHYLFPSPSTTIWSSGSQVQVLIKAYTSTTTLNFDDLVEATKSDWVRLKDQMVDHLRSSLPEASKEHQKSQGTVADEGWRWFSLTGTILDAHKRTATGDRPIPDIPAQPSLEILQEAVQLLDNRNWKPFGAASIMESAMRQAPLLFRTSSGTQSIFANLEAFLVQGQNDFWKSSSAPYIVSSITLLGQIPEQVAIFEQMWKSSISAVMQFLEAPEVIKILSKLISSPQTAALAQEMNTLQTELIRKCLECAVGTSGSSWELFTNVITFEALNEVSYKRLVKELTSRVASSTGQPNQGVVKGLQAIAQKRSDWLSKDEELYMSLMTSLLSLSEKPGVGPEVAMLQASLENTTHKDASVQALIQQNINSLGTQPLAIETLAQQAIQIQSSVAQPQQDGAIGSNFASLLPDPTTWTQQLSCLLKVVPNPSLALTNSLGGSCFLASNTSIPASIEPERDLRGCSIPGRMAMYMSRLISSGFPFALADLPLRTRIIINLTLTAELASDQLTVMDENQVWSSLSSKQSLSDCEELVASVRKLIIDLTESAPKWQDGSGTDNSQLVSDIIKELIQEAQTLSPFGFYCGRVLNAFIQALSEKYGFPSNGEKWLTDLSVLKASPTSVFPAVAILTGLGETVSTSKIISTFCNRLVSEIPDAKLGQEKSLATMVLLNACMQLYDLGELPVANNRLVFAVRQITSWLETPEDVDFRFATEACKSLQRLFPCIKDVYGSYWGTAISFCIHTWTKVTKDPLDSRLPAIHSSLRLMSTLQSLEEPNDDLVDAIETSAESRSAALVNLLQLPRERHTQPLEIVDSIICRQVEQLPLHHVRDLSELYGLIPSGFRPIQTAAFSILHKAVPAEVEKISVDVLLEKRSAQLPDELLSLLLDAPTLDMYPDEILQQFPTPVRAYLLSWHLIFDAFRAASFKVRSDYTENLKAENYIGPLLDFMFDVLGHSAAHGLSLDRSNFDTEHIRAYDLKLAESESEERNMQWLFIHLFYLILKYVPGLFKTWYIGCRSKQTKIAVEAWTARYFSPIIISEALDDVESWNSSQEAPADDEKELIVKVSRTAKEVVAGYEVDELNASIAIRIPPEFPLETVTVLGINRVAVNEKKWQSWILTTQGVITFSGGNIIDGLTTFRRNVVGALKGQSECAICYSIISTDKKMPDKRCQTCKNLFHRTCLYKWFQSSSQNTCPLCRNPIDYLGADTKGRR